MLAAGAGAEEATRQVLAEDGARSLRQFGIVDASGHAVSYTGADCTPWCGHRTGPGYAVQGNMLSGEPVVADMEAAFLSSEAENLAERLMRALEAGQKAGGR